jgi:hypothetical protein
MTDEQREAERIRSLASAVYRALDAAQSQEDYVRLLAAKHGNHPAFKAYMSEMLLTDRLAEFMARPQMDRA